MTNVYIALSQDDGGSLTIDGQLDVLTLFLESVTGRKPESEQIQAAVTKARPVAQKSKLKEPAHAGAD